MYKKVHKKTNKTYKRKEQNMITIALTEPWCTQKTIGRSQQTSGHTKEKESQAYACFTKQSCALGVKLGKASELNKLSSGSTPVPHLNPTPPLTPPGRASEVFTIKKILFGQILNNK